MGPADIRDVCRVAHILPKFGSWNSILRLIMFLKTVVKKQPHSYPHQVQPFQNIRNILHTQWPNAPELLFHYVLIWSCVFQIQALQLKVQLNLLQLVLTASIFLKANVRIKILPIVNLNAR